MQSPTRVHETLSHALETHSVSVLSAYMGRYLTLRKFGSKEKLPLKVVFFIQTAQYNGGIQVQLICMDVLIIIVELSVFPVLGNGLLV